ncbi:MAG: NB-ARC domain-containing protein, partial [Armatimonadota bacterium]|nr:NB-ARC domain-containing protein [Armatimonadota bacterium]
MTHETDLPLQIRLFGPFWARLNGELLPALRSRKGQHLLALLALRSREEAQREWLAETLWPDHLLEEALGSLRQSLSDLRKALARSRECILSPTPRTLQLDSGKAAVDVVEFDHLVAGDDEASLKRAVKLYHGPLLEGWTEPWIQAERAKRQEAYLGSLATLASRSLAGGDDQSAIHYLRLAATADPFRQETHRSLMRTLAKGGDEGAALQVYADLRHFLHAQYGAEPEEETYRLHRLIGAGVRRRLQARNAPTEPIRPETPHAGTAVRNARAESSSGASLPRPLTTLLGREAELREIEVRLFSSRLVTLVGPGGVGKTRLALQAASDTAGEYEDGVFFVDLASLAVPEAVPVAIASALSLGEERDRPPLQRLLDYLRGRRLLLVLDNCERLIGACAGLAQALLSGCRWLRILATSRERLGVTGEIVRNVPPLSLPTGADDPEAVLQSPAVALFVERAGAVCSTFTLTPDSTGDVVNICRRLDGVPLAIELAAPLVAALSPAQILERLDDRFRLLSEGASAGPDRHRSLQAVMESSYTLLTEGEKTLLQRLSVFAGGWTLEGAEAVGEPGGDANAATTLSLLSGLLRKSLVIAEEGPSGLRYRMLQTIGEYAAERLRGSGERDAIALRHQRFFAALAEMAETQLGGPEGAIWLRRLDREVENFRAALTITPPNPP